MSTQCRTCWRCVLSERSLLHLRLELLDVLLRVLVESVAAARAADVERLTLVADSGGTDAAANDTDGALALGGRERLAVAIAGDDKFLLVDRRAGRLAIEAIDETHAFTDRVHDQLL